MSITWKLVVFAETDFITGSFLFWDEKIINFLLKLFSFQYSNQINNNFFFVNFFDKWIEFPEFAKQKAEKVVAIHLCRLNCVHLCGSILYFPVTIENYILNTQIQCITYEKNSSFLINVNARWILTLFPEKMREKNPLEVKLNFSLFHFIVFEKKQKNCRLEMINWVNYILPESEFHFGHSIIRI